MAGEKTVSKKVVEVEIEKKSVELKQEQTLIFTKDELNEFIKSCCSRC